MEVTDAPTAGILLKALLPKRRLSLSDCQPSEPVMTDRRGRSLELRYVSHGNYRKSAKPNLRYGIPSG